jgi:hypothetical protein
MIGHDNGDVNLHLEAVVVETTTQGDRACFVGENPTAVRAEGYEMGLVVALQVREIAPVKCHGQFTTT